MPVLTENERLDKAKSVRFFLEHSAKRTSIPPIGEIIKVVDELADRTDRPDYVELLTLRRFLRNPEQGKKSQNGKIYP